MRFFCGGVVGISLPQFVESASPIVESSVEAHASTPKGRVREFTQFVIGLSVVKERNCTRPASKSTLACSTTNTTRVHPVKKEEGERKRKLKSKRDR